MKKSKEKEVSTSENENIILPSISSGDQNSEFELKIRRVTDELEDYNKDTMPLGEIYNILKELSDVTAIDNSNKDHIISLLGKLSENVKLLNPKKGGIRSTFKEIPWKKLIYLEKILQVLNADNSKQDLLLHSLRYICNEDVPKFLKMTKGLIEFSNNKKQGIQDYITVLQYRKLKLNVVNDEIVNAKQRAEIIAHINSVVNAIKNTARSKTKDKKEKIEELKNEITDKLINIDDKKIISLIIDLDENSGNATFDSIKNGLEKEQEYYKRVVSFKSSQLKNIMDLKPAYKSDKELLEKVIQKLIYLQFNLDSQVLKKIKPGDLVSMAEDLQIYANCLSDQEEGGIFNKKPILKIASEIFLLLQNNMNSQDAEHVKENGRQLLKELFGIVYDAKYAKENELLTRIKLVFNVIKKDLAPPESSTKSSAKSKKVVRQVNHTVKWLNQLKDLIQLLYLFENTKTLEEVLGKNALDYIISIINNEQHKLEALQNSENIGAREEFSRALEEIEKAEATCKDKLEAGSHKAMLAELVVPLDGVTSLCNYFFDNGNINKILKDLEIFLQFSHGDNSMTRCALLQVLFELGESAHDLTDIKEFTLESMPWIELVSLRNHITHHAMDTLLGIVKLNSFLLMSTKITENIDVLISTCIEDMQKLSVMINKLNELHIQQVSVDDILNFEKIIKFHYSEESFGFSKFEIPNLTMLRQYFHEPSCIITREGHTLKIVSLDEASLEETSEESLIQAIMERIQTINLILRNLNQFLVHFETPGGKLAARFCLTYLGEIFRELNKNNTFIISAPAGLVRLMKDLISLRGDIAHNMLVKSIILESHTFEKYRDLTPMFNFASLKVQLDDIKKISLEEVENDVTNKKNNINRYISGFYQTLRKIHSINEDQDLVSNLEAYLDSNPSLNNYREVKFATDCYLVHAASNLSEHHKSVEQITTIQSKWIEFYKNKISHLNDLAEQFKHLSTAFDLTTVFEEIDTCKLKLLRELDTIQDKEMFKELFDLLFKLEPHQLKKKGECFNQGKIFALQSALNAKAGPLVNLIDKYEDRVNRLCLFDLDTSKKEYGLIVRKLHSICRPAFLESLLSYLKSPLDFDVNQFEPDSDEREQLVITIHNLLTLTEDPTEGFSKMHEKWRTLFNNKQIQLAEILEELINVKDNYKDNPRASEQIDQYIKTIQEAKKRVDNILDDFDNQKSVELIRKLKEILSNRNQLSPLEVILSKSEEEKKTAWPKQIDTGKTTDMYQMLRERQNQKIESQQQSSQMEEGEGKGDPNPKNYG